MFGRIIFGLILAAIGAIITIKSEWILQNFGPIPSADRFFSTEGGSRLAYKLIGIIVTVVGFLIMTNLIEGVLGSIAKLLIPGI
ncbi:MAG: hypothetical protein A3J62_00780 [Candidatus Buchananbacteria bacterium RIFCSPHIGHO2_02_FULL_38_8]|uniref:Uncharacterized protein n=1 Tax=Candidatus Buchananbacteria bacterium RIFCSPHIGHO2_02_FULL_38_8 TaxID=1797538 RepID=A0A1G1Y846_9BACT|nr:MAG: hypothetical protein A3J62_00780 [Candidatus Buchananbacteria bacterium RIFCSPHIGHO2_02_FULL_38_8]